MLSPVGFEMERNNPALLLPLATDVGFAVISAVA
jgi:hypothetical protein